MVASDRSTDAVRATGWLLGGDGWPAGQLPPAMGRPRSTPTTRRASAEAQPRLGGLFSPLGDALLGQRLAQPGMLVVHVPSPSSSSACLVQELVEDSVVAGQLRMALWRGPRIRHLPYAGARLFPIFGRWLLTAAVSLRPVTRDNPGEMGGRVQSPTVRRLSRWGCGELGAALMVGMS